MGLELLALRCLVRFRQSQSFRFFSVNQCLCQEQAKGKKKWTKAQLQPLIEFGAETDGLYGPVVKTAQKSNKKAKSKPIENGKRENQAGTVGENQAGTVLTVGHNKIVVHSAVLQDAIDYEQVIEPKAFQSLQTKNNVNKKIISPFEQSAFDDVGSRFKDQSQKSGFFRNSVMTPIESEESLSKVTSSNAVEQNDTNVFLSRLLTFPPFTISWDAPNGRLSIADAAANATVLEPAPQDVGYAGVSTILKDTMPPENKFFLDRWEKEMIEKLGEEGFRKFKEDLFANGTNFHLCIQKFLEGQSLSDSDLKEANRGHWKSIQSVFSDISDVICIEKPVKHPVLHYKGILDCVANYRGKTCVIDWKTSKKQKTHIRQTYDNPLQLTAYLGAFNCQTKNEIDNCLLIIGYQDGSPASVHELKRTDCIHYWQSWQRRLHAYWSENLNKCSS